MYLSANQGFYVSLCYNFTFLYVQFFILCGDSAVLKIWLCLGPKKQG